VISYNTLIVLAGTSLLGACAGLVGSYAVLRRRALAGDALAHAALPGLCLAFLLLDEKNLPFMLLGALISGLLGMAIVSGLRLTTRVKEDAAIGIVLSVFFGAGIVLSRIIQNRTTSGSKAGLDSYILGKTAGMIASDIYLIAGVSLLCLLTVILLYKEFKVVSFDPDFAVVQGWPAFALDMLLMGMVAVAVVIGLPAVGVVMMAALLIIPTSAARFWTEDLGMLQWLSVLFGTATGIVGTYASSKYGLLPTGPVIVLVGTGFFIISLFFAPRRGMLAKFFQEHRFEKQLAHEALLRLLYEQVEKCQSANKAFSLVELEPQFSGKPRQLRPLLRNAIRANDIKQDRHGNYTLTTSGMSRAVAEVRVRRLWELLLSEDAEAVHSFQERESRSITELLPAEKFAKLESRLADSGREPICFPTSN
jgi:manganese/zinc/iron transport system permease protein